MNIKKYLFAISVSLFVALYQTDAANVIIRAKLDSATLLMGNTTALHIELVQDKGTQGFFPIDRTDTINSFVEIAARTPIDTAYIDNGREQIRRDIIIQAFDSGMYALPPIEYIVGKDTSASEPLALKVIPVKVDSLKDIHDFKPVRDVPFHLFDYVPWWILWILLGIILIGAVFAFVYIKWLRKGENPFQTKEQQLPPYEEAMQRLQQLKAQNLWQNGQEKQYYTILTDILREYIDRRFSINAVEMTTTQIIATLKENDETRAVNEQLKDILDIADFVKFANARPLADDNELALQRAIRFVEDTKPVEQPQPESKPSDDGILELDEKEEQK